LKNFLYASLLIATLAGCSPGPRVGANQAIGSRISALVPTAGGAPVASPSPAEVSSTNPEDLLNAGIREDLAGPNHLQMYRRLSAALSPADRQTLEGLLAQATDTLERILILKAFASGETIANVSAFAADIRGKNEDEVEEKCTMRDEDTLIQQYQQSCGMAMVQVASSEYDPRYAWEMNKLGSVHDVNPNGPIAQQQLQWLQQYGGTATPRGQEGGKEVGINGILNEKVGAFIHCSFTCIVVTDAQAALNDITAQLKAGFPAPIRVAFAGDIGHFMLVQAIRADGQFRVYDPYYGKVRWMPASAFQTGDLVPDSNLKVTFTHYYKSTPLG
jgi:hypothetical protein